LRGVASRVCGSIKALWLSTVCQFLHSSGATILGALRLRVHRVPLQRRTFNTAYALICSVGVVGYDLPRCVATLVGSPIVLPPASMLRDYDADCFGLAIEAASTF
jgi:hypothetical protein